jgi:hypothetical protein
MNLGKRGATAATTKAFFTMNFLLGLRIPEPRQTNRKPYIPASRSVQRLGCSHVVMFSEPGLISKEVHPMATKKRTARKSKSLKAGKTLEATKTLKATGKHFANATITQ